MKGSAMTSCKTDDGRRRASALAASLLAALALGIPAVAGAQPPPRQERPRPDNPEQAREPRASRELILELVRRATPAWDQRVLDLPQTRPWAEQLKPQRIAEILEDRGLAELVERAPDGARVFRTEESVLRFHPERGELRYVNNARAVDANGDVGQLPAGEEAQQRTLRILETLGLTRDQFHAPAVTTQMAGGGPAGARDMEVRQEVYRLVTVQRRLGDVPMFASGVRAAVNPRGQMQRLRVAWSQVTLPGKVRLVDAQLVLDQAVRTILEGDVSARAEVRGALAYVPVDERDPSVVVPAVIYTVLSPPTPFMVSVPVVEPVEGEIASVTADGAYDGEPVYQAAASRQPDPPPDVVIPPRASAVASTEDAGAQSQRDRHIRLIAEKGHMAWQKATGYGRRSHVETAVGRYKGPVGPRLRARTLSAQQGEAAIAAEVLNRMIRVAKPISVRVA